MKTPKHEFLSKWLNYYQTDADMCMGKCHMKL